MFLIIFISFTLVGLFSIVDINKSIVTGITLAVIIPFSSFYSSIHYFNGIMAIDGFFIGLIPSILLINLEQKVIIPTNILRAFVLSFVIFTIYFIVAIQNDQINIYYVLKDLRPLIHVFELFLLFFLVKNTSFLIKWKTIERIALFAGTSNILFFLLGFFGVLQFEDIFYQNNSNRYIDLSTYFSVYYLFHSQYKASKASFKPSKLATTLSLISILLTNSRVLILALIVGIGILRAQNLKEKVKYLFWSILVFMAFLQFSILIGQDRITDSLSSDGFTTQLIGRFSPALIPISDMSFAQILFGYGIGYWFEIPWFEYRGLNTHNISIDSAYLTHFVKQGLLGLIFIWITIKSLSFTGATRLNNSLMIFWLLQFLVEASLFQNVIYGATFYLFLLHKLDSNYEGKIA